MPVTDTHAKYEANLSQWQRCRDCFSGTDAVKARGQEYLPKLGGQNEEQYAAYLLRTPFFGAFGRTVQGLTGLVFRKDPSVECSDLVESQLDDVTLQGDKFDDFAKSAFDEMMITGTVGVLVDVSNDPNSVPRPYWTQYTAENIANWHITRINGVMTVTCVVLREIVDERDTKDMFSVHRVNQFRVLYLDDTRQYAIDIYRQVVDESGKPKDEWYVWNHMEPKITGKRLPYIPFSSDLECEKPPLLDLADMNLSHYRTMADLEHGRHFTALPTPWLAGFDPGKERKIGAGVAWVSQDPNAKCGMLEFTGQGLASLVTAASDKKNEMAALGGRILEAPKGQVEAADTLAMRSAGERSALATLANKASRLLQNALQWHSEWLGSKNPVSVALNTEFESEKLTPDEAAKLTMCWQAGGMSWRTYYHNMERGEMTRPGITADDELAEIQSEKPTDISITP